MDNDTKKALIVFGGGFILFYLLRPLVFREPALASLVPPVTQKQRDDAANAIAAFQQAMSEGLTAAEMDQLNQYAQANYGLKVVTKTDGSLYVVTDLGQTITV